MYKSTCLRINHVIMLNHDNEKLFYHTLNSRHFDRTAYKKEV